MLTAILSSPTRYSEIETAALNVGDEIVLHSIDHALNLTEDIQKVLNVKPGRLIIDLSAFKHVPENDLIKEIKKVRILSDKTLLYFVAPGYKRGNVLLHNLFTFGVYNIITTTIDDLPGELTENLTNVLNTPMTFNQAVKYLNDVSVQREDDNFSNQASMKKKEVDTVQMKSVLVHGKTVAVLNANSSAGSSFVTMCLAKFLVENELPTAIIESPYLAPYLYCYSRLDVAFEKEGFVSIPHLISVDSDITKYDEFYSEGISWVVADKALSNDKMQSWGHRECLALNRFSKSSAIKIWDVGSAFLEPGLKDFLKDVDLIIAVIDPLPANVITNMDKLKKLADMKRNGYNIEFVVNKYLKELDVNAVENILGFCVICNIDYVDPSEIFRLAASKKHNHIPLNSTEIKSELEKSLLTISKQFVPDGAFNVENQNKGKNSFIKRLLKG